MSTLVTQAKYSFLRGLGISEENHGVFDGKWNASGKTVDSINPATNEVIARVRFGNTDDSNRAIAAARSAYTTWADLSPPMRGEIVRQIGDSLRTKLQDLGKLVCLSLIFLQLAYSYMYLTYFL